MVTEKNSKEGDIRAIEWIEEIRHGGNVKRCHNFPIIGEQRVSAHTWGVLVIADKLYPDYLDSHLMRAITYHDVPEYITGDIPKNAKWRSPDIAAGQDLLHNEVLDQLGLVFKLDIQQHRVMKICDGIELMYFCMEQRLLGNRYVDRVFGKIRNHLKYNTLGLDENAKELIDQLTEKYGEIYAQK